MAEFIRELKVSTSASSSDDNDEESNDEEGEDVVGEDGSSERVNGGVKEGDEEVTQVFWIMRHGDRLNNVDRQWKKTAQYPHDTPLSDLGHNQAHDVACHIVRNDPNIQHILSSPFLRALETANPLSKQLNMPIKVEKSVWETGCAEAPPLHLHAASRQFVLDSEYTSTFEPTCGETTDDFFPRLKKAATGLLERFPVSSGNVAIFSHADPCAYLVSALCDISPAVTAPVVPCSVFRLERRQGESHFRLTVNGSIEHLSGLGKTEPCHPVHFYHDWCALFKEMREAELVPPNFQWPPATTAELDVLKHRWEERYLKLLQEGQGRNLPVIGPPRTQRKVCFRCIHCLAISYVKQKLLFKAPPCHAIRCWNCPKTFTVSDVVVIPEESTQTIRLAK